MDISRLTSTQAAASMELHSKLVSENESMVKSAALGVTEYLRERIKEDGFARKVMGGAVDIADGDLDRAVDHDMPIKIREKEANSAGAVSVPFNTGFTGASIDAPRYEVRFHRVMTPFYEMDTARLKTYRSVDIREMFHDLLLKDIMETEDTALIAAADSCVGTINTYATDIAACQYVECGPISRDALFHFRKGLPSSNRHLEPGTYLINNVFVWDIGVFDHDAMGGTMAEDILINGISMAKWQGVPLVITNKTSLVPDQTIYGFAPDRFLGDFFVNENVTMISELRDNMRLRFGAHELIGMQIGNRAAIVKGSFTGTKHGWTDTGSESE